MQVTQKDLEIQAEMPKDGKARRIKMPERNTLIVAGAITGGAVATGLIMYYYLRKRRMAH